MLDMRCLADGAFDQQDFIHGPADRRDLLRAQPVAAIVDGEMRLGRRAEHAGIPVHCRRAKMTKVALQKIAGASPSGVAVRVRHATIVA